jgi:hypothetical protein
LIKKDFEENLKPIEELPRQKTAVEAGRENRV